MSLPENRREIIKPVVVEDDEETIKKKMEELVKESKEKFLQEARDELIEQFKALDKDSNGYIDKDEAKNNLDLWLWGKGTKNVLSEDEVKEFMLLYDTNNDGKIDSEEFVNSMADLFAKQIENFITKNYISYANNS